MVNKTGTPILRVKNVSKTFGGVVCALDDVSLEVYPNEIVGVVGENGAGKTTLMKILVGIHAPDRGAWEHNGVAVPFPRNPKEAARKGISIVYQEKGVIPSIKVYQFLFLGNEEKYERGWGLQIGKMKQHAHEILEEFHVQCGIEDFMYDLALSTQKMVEIAKAVLRIRLEQNRDTTDSVIILDEPTAPLTLEERRGRARSACIPPSGAASGDPAVFEDDDETVQALTREGDSTTLLLVLWDGEEARSIDGGEPWRLSPEDPAAWRVARELLEETVTVPSYPWEQIERGARARGETRIWDEWLASFETFAAGAGLTGVIPVPMRVAGDEFRGCVEVSRGSAVKRRRLAYKVATGLRFRKEGEA